MEFKVAEALILLERTPQVLRSLLGSLPTQWTQANEGEDSWTPYDVVGHLVHGEKTDWIPRLEIVLDSGTPKTFEPYDRFAQFKMSKGKSLNELLSEFEILRSKNLEQLKAKNLTSADLTKEGIHPALGPVTLKNLLSAWVVHDHGHMVQIARVLAKQYTDEVGPWTKFMTVLNHTPKE